MKNVNRKLNGKTMKEGKKGPHKSIGGRKSSAKAIHSRKGSKNG